MIHGIDAGQATYEFVVGGTNLTDANSGANLKVGYQHLNAAQALSFVRERDNLPAGDLDRTARQQAVLDYVLWKLKTDGLLTDVGRLRRRRFLGHHLDRGPRQLRRFFRTG